MASFHGDVSAPPLPWRLLLIVSCDQMYFQEGRRLFVSYAARTQKGASFSVLPINLSRANHWTNSTVWSYLFSRQKNQPQLGAYHGSDLQRYYFLQAGPVTPGGAIDYQGVDYLISFICTMDPNSAQTERDYVHWPQVCHFSLGDFT